MQQHSETVQCQRGRAEVGKPGCPPNIGVHQGVFCQMQPFAAITRRPFLCRSKHSLFQRQQQLSYCLPQALQALSAAAVVFCKHFVCCRHCVLQALWFAGVDSCRLCLLQHHVLQAFLLRALCSACISSAASIAGVVCCKRHRVLQAFLLRAL